MKAGGRSAAQHKRHVPLAVARRGRRLARGLSQISMPHAYQRPPGASPAQPAGAGRSPCQRPARPPQRAATLPEALYISGADEPSRQRLIADPPLPPPPPVAAARTSRASGERFCWRAALAAAVQQTGWPIALAPRLRLVLLWGYRLPPLRPQLLLRVHMLRRAPLCCTTHASHTRALPCTVAAPCHLHNMQLWHCWPPTQASRRSTPRPTALHVCRLLDAFPASSAATTSRLHGRHVPICGPCLWKF